MQTPNKHQIVIAWTENDADFVRQEYIGGGEHRNIFKDVIRPKACMWLNEGTQADIQKAKDYLRSEQRDGRVFVYSNERDPLAKAKEQILCTKNLK